MSYIKQNFVDGQTLTAAQLNHMEDGIAAAQSSGGSSGAALSIGTVTSGSTASASITNNKLNLVLPKGDKGEKGDTGPQGPSGDAGTGGSSAPTYQPGKLGCVPFAQPAGSDYAQVIIYGQSLASGTESQIARTDTALDGVYMVGSSAHWYKAATLTGLNPCKNIGFESPIVAAVNHFATMYRRYRDPNQKFIANSTGLGGRSIERLSKGCTSYSYEYLYKDAFLDYLDNTKAAVTAQNKTVKCVALIFMQGEYNYDGHNSGQGFTNGTNGTTDKDEYKALLLQLKKDMQADVMAKYGQTEPPLFFVYQPGGAFITNGTSSINMAQQEAAAECEDMILLGSAMPCPRFAGGHMCSNGYRWQGEMIGKQLTESLLWGEADHTVLDRAITVEGNRVCIDYEVPVPPLVADTWTVQAQDNYGFSVYVDGVGVTVEKAEVQNTRVVLTCAKELSGKVAVKYAGNAVGDRTHRGIGNLRDSDPYTSLYTYADDTSETSSAGNTIDYRPKDAAGNSLNGKRYPLWNWASHAYREIIVNAIPATDFTPHLSSAKANVGDVLTLSVTYTPTNANGGLGITWKVSDDTKARVENGKVTILGGSSNDTVTITGTLANGKQHSVSVTISSSSNPYAIYYGYWDFSNGSSSNTTTVHNLATGADDSVLVGIDGSTSGYLTTAGLTLGANSAVKIPVASGMPDGMEIYLEVTFPGDKYNYNGMRLKTFLSLTKSGKDQLECGTEKYGYAWPELRGLLNDGTYGGISWRGATDSGGTSLGNTGMWWSGSTLHQHIRLRLNASGVGEFAMRADSDRDWRTWALPTYNTTAWYLPGFTKIKDACESILLGNCAALSQCVEGVVLQKAYIKEYNG